jgi:23S rRNA pseudouridine1911/1915/1917 synthase
MPARQLVQIVSGLLRCSPQVARQQILEGLVEVNQKQTLDTRRTLQPGDRVEVHRGEPRRAEQQPLVDRLAIRIVHEDSELLVVEKPAGLLTVPTPHREKHTLLALLARKLQHERQAARSPELFSVHRLDRDVSGLLLVARTLETAEQLREQFAERKPHRRYEAFVAGQLQPHKGTIRSFLATDDQLNRHSVPTAEQGELAITHYEVLRELSDSTHVSVTLETGRRNQIRVHLSEQGHPVLGETRYRRDLAAHPAWPWKRLALHACELGFRHPHSGRELHFHSRLPPEFKQFLKTI